MRRPEESVAALRSLIGLLSAWRTVVVVTHVFVLQSLTGHATSNAEALEVAWSETNEVQTMRTVTL